MLWRTYSSIFLLWYFPFLQLLLEAAQGIAAIGTEHV